MADGLGNQFGRLGLVVRPHHGAAPASFNIIYNGDVAGVGPVTNATFTNVPLGVATASRVVAVTINAFNLDSTPSTAVTIGGVSASLQIRTASPGDGRNYIEMWSAVVPTGTVGDIVVSGSAAGNFITIYPSSIYGAGSATAFDTGTSQVNPMQDPTFTGPAGGGGLGYVSIGGGTPVLDWHGATEVFNSVSTDELTLAKQLFAISATPGMTLTWPSAGSFYFGIFASWSMAVVGAALLLETGDYLLLENGSKLLL